MRKYEKPVISLITLTSINSIASSGTPSPCTGDWIISQAKSTPGGCYTLDFSVTNPAGCWLGDPSGV